MEYTANGPKEILFQKTKITTTSTFGESMFKSHIKHQVHQAIQADLI